MVFQLQLHHAGFVMLKKNYMPSLDITTYGEMLSLIAYFTQLEGMAVYAAYDERQKEKALNNDEDYVALQNAKTMQKFTKRYFEIFIHFQSNPNDTLTENDWKMMGEMSSDNRLWYRVGALMAMEIDKNFGRETLTGLIAQPSENFIKKYLEIKKGK